MTRNTYTSRFRPVPDTVILAADGTVPHGERAPVRIFLGSEDRQWRAERVFFYAIEQVRDPHRTYEIHVMKNLDGFQRDAWRTGFTHYRFAIPDFAGREGKAIYNDVDQIYLADPAELFDLDLDGHGYLSVSSADTSVMLLDCARMARWWTREKAIQTSKPALLRAPSTEAGIWGRLDECWNARDLEYREGDSKLLHFTALHTQPWQPFPEIYSYHDHPLGELWHGLERRADQQGYQVFGPERPSPWLAVAIGHAAPETPPPVDPRTDEFFSSHEVHRVLAATLNNNDPAPDLSRTGVTGACPSRIDRITLEPTQYDAVVAVGSLERCPAEDIPWLLEALFARARRSLVIVVKSHPQFPRDAELDVTRTLRPLRWWHQQVAATASRYPAIAWQIEAHGPSDELPVVLRADRLGGRNPTVWILEGHRRGDNAQLKRLAEALGWPVTRKSLRFNPLHLLPNVLLGASRLHLGKVSRVDLAPPWPDIVLALGKRSSGVARWIKRQSGNRARLVHLGRPWAPLAAFDLVVTTPQYRLPARANIVHNTLPLTPIAAARLRAHRREIEPRFAAFARPLIGVLVGGSSTSQVLDRRTACRLGETASQDARQCGGTLLVATGPRTGPRATDALLAAIDAPCKVHRYEVNPRHNAYMDFLAMADKILVTDDSASMIADALAAGVPVTLYPVPRRAGGRLASAMGLYLRWLRGPTDRGTPRQQGPMARFVDALVERGIVMRPRRLSALHESLAQRGLTGNPSRELRPDVPETDLAVTVERVKDLFNWGRPLAAYEARDSIR